MTFDRKGSYLATALVSAIVNTACATHINVPTQMSNYLPLRCLISVNAPGMGHVRSWSAMHPAVYFWHNAWN